MSNFTKGTWKIAKMTDHFMIVAEGKGVRYWDRTIAGLVFREANARLIATTPEMYELIHTLASLPDEQCMISPLITKARKLIASIDESEAQS